MQPRASPGENTPQSSSLSPPPAEVAPNPMQGVTLAVPAEIHSAPPPPNPRKRPSPPGHDRQPGKRERKDPSPAPPRRRKYHETALTAWDKLKAQEPDREDFTESLVLKEAENEWVQLHPPERLHSRWRRDFLRFVRRDGGMFRRSTKENAPLDAIVLSNRDYTDATAKRRAGDGAAGKRGDGTSGDGADDNCQWDGNFANTSVPSEWTKETYKPVRLSPFDKSVGMSFINEQENVVTAVKGFRTIRATTGVCSGDWFFEVTVLPTKNSKAAVRLGWSMRRCDTETPVGFDAYGYGIRDRSGEFVHVGYRKQYGQPFGVGDVIGCRLVLPELDDEQHKKIVEADQRWLHWRFIGFKQGALPVDSGVDLWPQGRVEFYKNGVSMGVPKMFLPSPESAGKSSEEQKQPDANNNAHKEQDGNPGSTAKRKESGPGSTATIAKKGIVAGYYFPSISLFKDGVARANFGPDFKFGLPEGCRPMCEAAKDPPEEKPEPAPPTLENGLLKEEKDPNTDPNAPKDATAPQPHEVRDNPSPPEVVVLSEAEQERTDANGSSGRGTHPERRESSIPQLSEHAKNVEKEQEGVQAAAAARTGKDEERQT